MDGGVRWDKQYNKKQLGMNSKLRLWVSLPQPLITIRTSSVKTRGGKQKISCLVSISMWSQYFESFHHPVIEWLVCMNYSSFVERWLLLARYYNMALTKCRRSGGYKTETKQEVALTAYNLDVQLCSILPVSLNSSQVSSEFATDWLSWFRISFESCLQAGFFCSLDDF